MSHCVDIQSLIPQDALKSSTLGSFDVRSESKWHIVVAWRKRSLQGSWWNDPLLHGNDDDNRRLPIARKNMSTNIPISSSSPSATSINVMNHVGATTAAAVATACTTSRNHGLGVLQWMQMHHMMLFQKITLRYMYNYTVEEWITAVIKELVSGTQTYNFVYWKNVFNFFVIDTSMLSMLNKDMIVNLQ